MKSFVQHLTEEERDTEHGLLFHTSHQSAPIDGKDKKFNKKVTWFFSQKHDHEGHPAHVEASAIMRNDRHGGHHQTTVNVYRPKHKLNLASEDQVNHAAAEVGHPSAGEAYESLDSNVNAEPKHTVKLVNHLKKQGFHGAEHRDYSQVNHENDRTTVALFHPHEHLDHVESSNDSKHLAKKYGKT